MPSTSTGGAAGYVIAQLFDYGISTYIDILQWVWHYIFDILIHYVMQVVIGYDISIFQRISIQ